MQQWCCGSIPRDEQLEGSLHPVPRKEAQGPGGLRGHAHPDELGHPQLTNSTWMCFAVKNTKRKGKSKAFGRFNPTWEDGNPH